ncbi:MAG: hypothetical protein WBN03_18780, partial [Desulfobacterales bacterium]
MQYGKEVGGGASFACTVAARSHDCLTLKVMIQVSAIMTWDEIHYGVKTGQPIFDMSPKVLISIGRSETDMAISAPSA